MRRHYSILLSTVILGLIPNLAMATEEGSRFFTFELGGIYAAQSDGGNSLSGEIRWTPELRLTNALELKLSAGASLFKGSVGSTFVMADFEGFLGLQLFGPILIEAGGGEQSWFGYGGFNPLLSADLAWRPRDGGSVLGLFSRVYAGGSYVFGVDATEIRLGVGISL